MTVITAMALDNARQRSTLTLVSYGRSRLVAPLQFPLTQKDGFRMRLHRIYCSAASAATPLFLAAVAGCGGDAPKPAVDPAAVRNRDAVRKVLDVDVALGRARDQVFARPKNLVEAAAAVRQYVAAASAIDMKDAPEDFAAAYRRHVDAWRVGGELIDHYSGITGMFRVSVDGEAYAKSRLDGAQAAVKDSWNEVRARARAHGVENVPD